MANKLRPCFRAFAVSINCSCFADFYLGCSLFPSLIRFLRPRAVPLPSTSCSFFPHCCSCCFIFCHATPWCSVSFDQIFLMAFPPTEPETGICFSSTFSVLQTTHGCNGHKKRYGREKRSTWSRCFHLDIIDNTINLRSFNLTQAGEKWNEG